MKKSRMFRLIVESEGKTWTPVPGCSHKCPYYCWAMDLVAPRVGGNRNCDKCRNGIPHTHFEMRVPKAKIIFVDSWADLFCNGVKNEWIRKVIEIGPKKHPKKDFLFCTKNTPRYLSLVDLFPENCLLGGTVETNKDKIYPKSNAPLPSERYESLEELDWPRKFLSAEPLLDFDLDTFLEWIISVDPEYCEIGYDNYASRTLKKMGSYLPEPSQSKTNKLIEEKKKAGIDTHRKSIRKAWWEEADETDNKGNKWRKISKKEVRK